MDFIGKVNSIFIIYYSDLGSRNGSNTHILELFQNLNKYLKATLFVPEFEGKLSIENIKYVPYLKIQYLGSISYDLSLSLHLVYYFTKARPQILYLRQNSVSFIPTFLCNILGIQLIVEINGLIQDEFPISLDHNNIFSKIYGYLSLQSEKLNYKNCSKIVSVTKGLKEELIKNYKVPAEKIIVINNGANTDLFRPIFTHEAKEILDLDLSRNYICFVGNLVPWQGVEYLVQASPLILEKEPSAIFLIVGDGIIKEKLIALTYELDVADKFIFTGSVPYEKVPMYINASDICVAPFIKLRNTKIGLSALKTYEYMSCGKPVVVSDIPGQSELVSSSGGGFTFAADDSSKLAEEIIKLLANPYLRNEMGKKGRDHIVANHSWNAVAKKVIDVCEDVLGDRLK